METIQSPARAEILMRAYWDPNYTANMVPRKVFLDEMVRNGAVSLDAEPGEEDPLITITHLGRAWVAAILKTAKPRIVYVDADDNILTL